MLTLNFDKLNGLIPACVQDYQSMQVLMIGFMNQAALEQTLATGRVTFFSRSKDRLWTKGETSGHYLSVIECVGDCDQDSVLILATPAGPTCHTGETSCFNLQSTPPLDELNRLLTVIDDRYQFRPADSYATSLFNQGTQRIAQKVGEEGVEVALAAVSGDPSALANETADLLFHLLILLKNNQVDLAQVMEVLAARRQSYTPN